MKHIPILNDSEDYPGSYYQPLFDIMHGHGLILVESELQEIINCVNKMQEAETFDLIKHLDRQKQFSLKAFGPEGRAIGILNHLKKEIKEIEDNPNDPMEWIDVILLSFDRLWRMGNTSAEISSLLNEKLTKNENRKWPDWRTLSENEAIEHDRTIQTN